VWIKALHSDSPYCALDLLVSANGLRKRSTMKKARPDASWFPPEAQVLKWNVDYHYHL
jgi:hypothetical protein